ncbi:unnamed protein product [Mytilus coruscus]|uniref:Uncharacterized protein n=1 Tax=Mytilus coruscus TaxID=42192 RepID=A0A6J8BVW1_MYTCO|nr:unnamed protein product [Mytilus coruscus]
MYGTYAYSNGAKVLGILVPLFLTIALVMICVGIGLPYWIILGETNYGLFQVCNSTMFTQCFTSVSYFSNYSNNSLTFWYTMIFLACFGALFMLISEICVFIYPCYKVITKQKIIVGVVLVIFLLLGSFFILSVNGLMIGVAVESALTKTTASQAFNFVGWTFYLCGVGGIISLVTSIMFIIHLYLAVYH